MEQNLNQNQNNALLEKALGGDFESIEQIILKYRKLVTSIARKYFLIGGDRDDLVQEGMMGLFCAIKTYDNKKSASFKTFATMVIERSIQSAVKKANALKHKNLNERVSINSQGQVVLSETGKESESIYIPIENAETVNMAKSIEARKYITSEIENKLSDLEKRILMLFIKGYDYNSIAEKESVTSKAVDNALTRIRSKLKHLKIT